MAVTQSQGVAGFFGRLTWMMFGPLAPLVLLIPIVTKGEGWLTAADIGYVVALAVMLLGRCLEFWEGKP
jgi:type IV secretory pathway VirB2 component (pilin)